MVDLGHLGHVASTRDLTRAGATARHLDRLVRSGAIERLRPGTYACSHLDDDTVLAATAGTRIDCLSLLARIPDAWCGRGATGLHVRAAVGRHVGPLPPTAVVHRPRRGEHGVVGALLSATRCLDPVDWLACVESALHLRRLDDAGLARLSGIRGGPTGARWIGWIAAPNRGSRPTRGAASRMPGFASRPR